MSLKTCFLSLVCASLLLGVMASDAEAITLEYGIDKDHFLGVVDDGIPSNPQDEVDYINNLNDVAAETGPVSIGTENYDRTDSNLAGPFKEAVLGGAYKDETTDETNNDTTLNDTFHYVLGKYGKNAGSLVWYFDSGITGEITVPGTYGDQNLEVSHISAYKAVPEPATLALVLFGLGGAFLFKRKTGSKKNT